MDGPAPSAMGRGRPVELAESGTQRYFFFLTFTLTVVWLAR